MYLPLWRAAATRRVQPVTDSKRTAYSISCAFSCSDIELNLDIYCEMS